MITGRDFVILSSTAWDALWEANHELSTRLALAGNRVFYVEHMGFRAPRLRQLGRVFRYLKRWFSASKALGRREVAEGLHISTPIVLPPLSGAVGAALNRRFFLPVMQKAAARIGITDPIIITYVPTDTAVDLIESLATPRSTVVAWWVADYHPISSNLKRLLKSEWRLLEISDLVLAQGPAIAAYCSQHNDNVVTINPGVDLDAFPLRSSPGEEPPPELAGIEGPIIGYIGGLHTAVDYDLLHRAIPMRPEWTWVFIGDVRAPNASLPALPNVRHLGPRPHRDLVRYLRRFSVGIVPYLVEQFTSAVLPTKLHEYLAAGRPAVSTRLPLVVDYERRHPVFGLSDSNAEAFIAAIEAMLGAPDDQATRLQRRNAAAEDDWKLRLEEVGALITKVERDRAGSAPQASRELRQVSS